jgi:hypothetical protein
MVLATSYNTLYGLQRAISTINSFGHYFIQADEMPVKKIG